MTSETTSGVVAAAHALSRDAAAAWTVGLLEDAGIPSVLLKGASFQWFWPKGVPRSYGDVDVLVPEARLAATTELLEKQGFTRRPSVLPPNHAVTLDHPHRTTVDLHWSIPGIAVSSVQLWSILKVHQLTIRVADRHIAMLDQVATSLHAVIHAAAHGSGDPRTERDLRALLEAPVDWRAVVDLAGQVGAMEALRLGLERVAAGSELADRLGLESGSAVKRYEVLQDHRISNLHLTVGLRWPDRIRLRIRQLFPRPEAMRAQGEPLAGGARAWFVLAYPVRWVRLTGAALRLAPTYVRLRVRDRRDRRERGRDS